MAAYGIAMELVADNYIDGPEYQQERLLFETLSPEETFAYDDYGDIALDTEGEYVVLGRQYGKGYLPKETLDGYADVYDIDSRPPQLAQWYSLRESGQTIGGAWVTMQGTDFAIYGIRSALVNSIQDTKRKGVGQALLAALEHLAKTKHCTDFIAVWPLSSMHTLLRRNNFHEWQGTCAATQVFVSEHIKNHWVKKI